MGVTPACGPFFKERNGSNMKISEAMSLCDRFTGEPVDSEMKLIWLERLEGMIYDEIISTHENAPSRPLSCHEGDRELLANDTYAQIYVLYMAMQNDLLMRDAIGYCNSASMFGSAYNIFADWYNRTHTPLSNAASINI